MIRYNLLFLLRWGIEVLLLIFLKQKLFVLRSPRGSGTKESLCRANESGKADVKNRRILCFVQDVPMPGGAGSPIEGKQKAFVPPPAGRAGRDSRKSFRGKNCFPLAGSASRGRVIPPRRGTRRPPLGASGALPPRSARHAGGGFPGFADSTTWDRSARLPELSVTRFA